MGVIDSVTPDSDGVRVQRHGPIALSGTLFIGLIALPATAQAPQQVSASEERASAGQLDSPSFMDTEIKRKLDAIMSALTKDHDSCNRGAFNHDLANLDALAEIARNAAQAEERKLRIALSGRFHITPGGFAISPGAMGYHLKDPLQLVDEEVQRQRHDEKTSYGRAFMSMVAINRDYLWARSWGWKHCKETTTVVQRSAVPPPEDSDITAADVDRVLRSIEERKASERPKQGQQKPTGPLHARIEEARLRLDAEKADCHPTDMEFYKRLRDEAWRRLQASNRAENRAEYEKALYDFYDAQAVFNAAYESCRIQPAKIVTKASSDEVHATSTDTAPGIGPDIPLGGSNPYAPQRSERGPNEPLGGVNPYQQLALPGTPGPNTQPLMSPSTMPRLIFNVPLTGNPNGHSQPPKNPNQPKQKPNGNQPIENQSKANNPG